MTSTAHMHGEYDVTHIPAIVAGSVKLGLLESIVVLLFSLGSRLLQGALEALVGGVILLLGLAAVTMLPGLWTRARTVEGISGAAGIGLGAAAVFLLLDVILLQNIGTYTHRWHAIGGGSNWWYHPVWWMVGAFLPWMGAWILANQTEKHGQPSAISGLVAAIGFTAVVAVLAIVLGFPGAGWNVATFGIAFVPGLVLATALSAMGKRRA
jgi:hypothetical protein